MKLLLLFLLLPCCMQAQRFVVKDVRSWIGPRQPFTFTIWLGNLDGTITAVADLTDKKPPAIRDTLFYDGQNWRWGKQFLHLYKKAVFEVLPKAQMKAYNKDSSQWLESLDTNRAKVYFQEGIARGGGGVPIDFYHNFSQQFRNEEMRKEAIQMLIDNLKRHGVNTIIKKQ